MSAFAAQTLIHITRQLLRSIGRPDVIPKHRLQVMLSSQPVYSSTSSRDAIFRVLLNVGELLEIFSCSAAIYHQVLGKSLAWSRSIHISHYSLPTPASVIQLLTILGRLNIRGSLYCTHEYHNV